MQIQPAAAAVLVAYLIADAALVAVAFGTATSAVGTSGCKIEIETLWVSWLHLIRLHQDIRVIRVIRVLDAFLFII